MAIVVILVLAILWAAVLIPPILRARAEGGGPSGVTGGMGEVLSRFSSAVNRGRGGGLADLPPVQGPVGPMGMGSGMGSPTRTSSMTPAQRRRRDILIGLLCAVGITLVMAAASGGSAVYFGLQLVCDVALGGYIYMLLQMKSRQHGRRAVVQPFEPAGRRLRAVPPLADTGTGGEPALALRRTATY